MNWQGNFQRFSLGQRHHDYMQREKRNNTGMRIEWQIEVGSWHALSLNIGFEQIGNDITFRSS